MTAKRRWSAEQSGSGTEPAPPRALSPLGPVLRELSPGDLQLMLERGHSMLRSLEVHLDRGARISLPDDLGFELATSRRDLMAFRLKLTAISLELPARRAVRLALRIHFARLLLQVRFGVLLPHLRLGELLRPICQSSQQVRDIDARGGIGSRGIALMHDPRCVRPRLRHIAMLAGKRDLDRRNRLFGRVDSRSVSPDLLPAHSVEASVKIATYRQWSDSLELLTSGESVAPPKARSLGWCRRASQVIGPMRVLVACQS
jgi:hypothetical protein